jgi:hypothetical protein
VTVAKEPDRRGEHEGNRKTIARGMPGDSGVLVVTRVRSTTTKCTRGRGCNGHPAFPAPSDRRVRKFRAKPRAYPAARSRGRVCMANCFKFQSGSLSRAVTVEPYNIPDSSSSAFSISSSLTTTLRRGTKKIIVEAQPIDRTTMAMLSGTGVAKWPPR